MSFGAMGWVLPSSLKGAGPKVVREKQSLQLLVPEILDVDRENHGILGTLRAEEVNKARDVNFRHLKAR